MCISSTLLCISVSIIPKLGTIYLLILTLILKLTHIKHTSQTLNIIRYLENVLKRLLLDRKQDRRCGAMVNIASDGIGGSPSDVSSNPSKLPLQSSLCSKLFPHCSIRVGSRNIFIRA